MQPENVVNDRIEMPKVVTCAKGQPISPTVINRIVIGVILLMILIHIGFYKTYIQHFPKFEEYTAGHGGTRYTIIMHLHGMLMMGWVWMLLLQPILILKGKINLHHRIGSLSYILAPLMLLSLYMVNRDQYHDLLTSQGQTAAVTGMAISLPEGVFFAILYSLAIYYRHRPALHMRFMCSTLFLFMNPAMGRMFRTWFGIPGHATSSLIVLAIAGCLALLDSWRTKRVSPFTLVFGLLLLHRIIYDLRETPLWQATGRAIANVF